MGADDAQMDADEARGIDESADVADGAQMSADGKDFPYKDLTEKVIGAAFEVHRELGYGFLEKVYEVALLRELSIRELSAESQVEMRIGYKGQLVGSYFADILVEKRVICEVKAIDALTEIHEAQLLHYLKATGLPLGLLLNFGTPRVQVKRLVRTDSTRRRADAPNA